MDHLVVSPCSTPDLPLEVALERFAALGYRQFEAFTSWAASAVDLAADPAAYRTLGARYGMTFRSMHLPPVEDEDLAGTGERAVAATRFAAALGATRVLFKATSRPAYIAAAPRYLDAIAGLGVIPVLQNHAGSPLATVADFREVLAGISDPRMRTLLEVGQFVRAGERWEDGLDLLSTRSTIGLVHFRDMRGGKEVPFGEGDLDLRGLFQRLRTLGYDGEFVVEMEVAGATTEETMRWLGEARTYSLQLLEEAGYE
ncbi:MAG TPA: TIM barrel protein [Armatimonadota bacterium]|jgi:sugar phosphate isomerase/epimerase